MSTKTSTPVTDLPKVNLLPPEIHEDVEFRRLVAGVAGLVVLSVVAVGALYVQGKSTVQGATKALAADQQKQATLERNLDNLQYVVTSASNVSVAEAALAQARSTNVHWGDVLADLSTTLPARAWYTDVSIKETAGVAGFATASAAPTTIGSVTFAGFANVHNDMATWLDDMSALPYVASPYLTTSTEEFIGTTKVVKFASTVAVNSSAIKGCDTPGVC